MALVDPRTGLGAGIFVCGLAQMCESETIHKVEGRPCGIVSHIQWYRTVADSSWWFKGTHGYRRQWA
jgi:hypothetical protein